jgi:hypothetical protein
MGVRSWLIVLLFAWALCACGDVFGRSCLPYFSYAIVAEVRSATGGAPIFGATVIATQGAATWTLAPQRVWGDAAVSAARYELERDRGGTYTVNVSAPGHRDAQLRVEVDFDGCHAVTLRPVITLSPQ